MMRKIINILLAGMAILLAACEADERIYGGPDIVYFDNGGLVRDEIADNNTVMTFRLVSPVATKHDREYTIVKRFGSTMEEGVDYTFPKGRKAVIKAGQYWVDVDIAITPESLSAKVDTLSFGIEPHSGEVAQFDNELHLLVSKRCDFIPQLYAGTYKHRTTLFDYMPDHEVELTVVTNPDGSVAEDQLLIRKPYGESDVVMKMDYSNPKKVTPVIDMQVGGTISTYDPWMNEVTAEFYVHTTEIHTYPGVYTKSPNESYLYTCSGEFVIYVIGGVFFQDEKTGKVLEGIIGAGAAMETFKRLEPPYQASATAYSEALNVEVQAVVKTAKCTYSEK